MCRCTLRPQTPVEYGLCSGVSPCRYSVVVSSMYDFYLRVVFVEVFGNRKMRIAADGPDILLSGTSKMMSGVQTRLWVCDVKSVQSQYIV